MPICIFGVHEFLLQIFCSPLGICKQNDRLCNYNNLNKIYETEKNIYDCTSLTAHAGEPKGDGHVDMVPVYLSNIICFPIAPGFLTLLLSNLAKILFVS